MKYKKQPQERRKETKTLLKFLVMTKSGKFAPIEESSLEYSRINDKIESVEVQNEHYYYGLS